MTHPFVGGLLRQAKMRAFHAEADALMCRIAKLVPGTKLTLLIRHPDHPDGSHDILLTDDEEADAIAAIEVVSKREKREPVKG